MTQFRIRCMVIDSEPNIASARKLALKFPGRIFLCQYKGSILTPILWKEEDLAVYAQFTESLQTMYGRIMMKDTRWPVHERFNQVKAELLNLVPDTIKGQFGQEKRTFISQGPDHFAHTLNYMEIARSRDSSMDFGVSTLAELQEKEDDDFVKTMTTFMKKHISPEFAREYINIKQMLQPTSVLPLLMTGFADMDRSMEIILRAEEVFPVKDILVALYPIGYNGAPYPEHQTRR